MIAFTANLSAKPICECKSLTIYLFRQLAKMIPARQFAETSVNLAALFVNLRSS